MAENTGIQWTNHTINFWTGCTKVSEGCKFCYMYRDQERWGKDPTELLQVRQSTINKILKKAKPGDKIFTCSWSDFFIEGADKWRAWAWDIIRAHPQFIWQILTKRPERAPECLPEDWGEGWNHVWLGVSVENQQRANERVPLLLQTPAKVRFLSCEPLLEKIKLTFIDCNKIYPMDFPGIVWGGEWCMIDALTGRHTDMGRLCPDVPRIDWVIIGGESGHENGKYKYRPVPMEAILSLRDDLQAAGVPVFIKQLGTYISKVMGLKDNHGGDWDEWPESLRIREFPMPLL